MTNGDGKDLPRWWNHVKDFVEHSVSFSNDAVHIILGVLILLAASILLRKPISSWIPWLVVLVFTCLNEASDLWLEQWPDPGRQYGEVAKDILLTMLLPTVLLVTVRTLPRVYGQPSGGE